MGMIVGIIFGLAALGFGLYVALWGGRKTMSSL